MDNRAEDQEPGRHCMVVLAYYPAGETRVQRQAEALAAQGHTVDVLCLRGRSEKAYECHHGVNVHRLPTRLTKSSLTATFFGYLRFFALAAIELTRLHKRHRYGVVQVHNLPDFLVFCALVPKLEGAAIVLDLHDLMPEFYEARLGENGPAWLGRAVRWQERQSCRFAGHVITVSEHWRQSLIQRGVPPGKCSVVMNVPDSRVFSPRIVPRQPGPDRPFRLIYHGGVVKRYGLDLAVQAIDLLRADIPNIKLTIHGWGDLLPSIVQMIEERGLHNHVTLHEGLIPLEDLPDLLCSADLGLVPYRNDVFTSGILPTKLMEYVAMGLPCVAARTTAIESYFDGAVEFFTPGDSGDLARSIFRLYSSPDQMSRLSLACREFNQRYNWARLGAEYVSLMEQLGSRANRMRQAAAVQGP